MKNSMVKKVTSLALACLLAGTCLPAEVFAAGEKENTAVEASSDEKKETEEVKEEEKADANEIKKDETVYVNLNADGSVREIIITDKIHSEDPKAVVEDKTDLKDIEIIKGGSLKEEKDGKLFWQMEDKDLYYRGKSSKKLPFDISIKYILNGKEMKPSKIAGKSGDLKIVVDFKNNMAETASLNGASREFYSPMALVALFTLPTDKFTHVEGEDVEIITEGGNTMVAVASVPGLKESLDLDNNRFEEIEDITLPEHFEITCKVENFEMGAIALTATGGFPDDVEEFDLDFIDELDENLDKVKRIKNNFETIDDDRALRDALLDDEKTKDLQEMAKDIDALLDMNTDFADNLDKYLTKETVDSLLDVIEEMQDIDIRYLKDFNYAEDFNDEHPNSKQKNTQLGKGVEKALYLFDTIDFDALNAAYEGKKALGATLPGLLSDPVLKVLLANNFGEDTLYLIMGMDDETKADVLLKFIKENPVAEEKEKIAAAQIISRQDADTFEFMDPSTTPERKTEMILEELGEVPEDNAKKQAVKKSIKKASTLNSLATQYMAIQNAMQPMMDATIAMGEFPKDAYLRQMVHSARSLYDDFVELYPSISAMKDDLKKENIKESFRQSPEMTEILVRLKKNLDKNKDLSDSIRKFKDDENIEMLRDIVSTLDEIDKDEIIDKYSDKMDKIQDMISRKDILKDMEDRNTVYTDKADNMKTSYAFVLKTDEIEAPEEEEKVEQKEEVSGLKKFFQNLFK